MSLPRLWTTSGQELDPLRAIRREMENVFRAFDQNSSSPNIGAGAPAISVAETKDAFEVTVELPGVDEKDINVSLDENQLVISGEKRAESTKEEKDWHVEERSYGSFYRSMSLPFEPEDGAVDAHFDKGVLHLTIKKPAKATKVTKTINVKTGAPPSVDANKTAAPNKASLWSLEITYWHKCEVLTALSNVRFQTGRPLLAVRSLCLTYLSHCGI